MKKLLLKPKFKPNELVEYLQNQAEAFIVGDKIQISLTDWTEYKTKNIPVPEIVITQEAFIKMMYLIMQQSVEIAWHGVVTQEDNTYIITDILVYPQTVASSTVDADEEEYSNWIMSNMNIINQIRMQGHSHVNMPVNPSGVDNRYYEELIQQVDDYYIFLIVNKKWDVYVRFYDMKNNIMYTDLQLLLEDVLLDEFYEDAITNFQTKKQTYIAPNVVTYGGVKK